MCRLHIFQVVGDVGKLAAHILKAALFQMLLDGCVALRVTVDGDCAFFFVLFVVFVDVEIDHVEDEFFHIHAVFLLESEHTFVVEQESQ